jgi:DNA polymerase III delta prime subunit
MVDPGTGSLPLAERLRPHRLDQLIGNARARDELRAWGEAWKHGPPARRAVLLAGPPGVGKTTAALALAHEFGWTLVEMNASDARNQSAIEQVAGRASITHTLDGGAHPPGARRALILLDEADCLTGRASEPARSAPEPPALGEFLRSRYGAVESMNAAWGLGTSPRLKPFLSWSAVPRSPGNFAWARLPAARKDIEVWRSLGVTSDLSDRGGLGAIARLVRATRQPLVLTVNDDRPLSRYSPVFRTAVLRLRFFPVREDELVALLGRAVRSERLSIASGVVEAIARRAAGDVRAALNDLDAVSLVPAGPGQREVLGSRDLSSDFAAFTEEALNRPRFYRAGEVRDRLDSPPDDLLPWIEENLVRFAPDAAHRAAAFSPLVVADRFLVRARRFRTYGLWSYASELLAGGVGLALRDRDVPAGPGAVFPDFLGEMGRSRAMRAVRDSVVAKVAGRDHLSRQKARIAMLPLLEALLAPAPGHRVDRGALARGRAVASEFELTGEELAFLLRVSPGDPRATALSALPPADDEAAKDAPEEPASASPPPDSPTAETKPAKKPSQRQLGEFEA